MANTKQVERLCRDPYSNPQISQQLGLDVALVCDRDPESGMYLQTYIGGFMVTETYGFAYQPNSQGSRRFSSGKPEDYRYGRIIGDWCWFYG